MPRISTNFPTAQPGPVEPYVMNFTGYLPAGSHLQSAQWDLSVDRTMRNATPDGNPAGNIVGAATVSTDGTSTQRIGPLIAGNDYVVTVVGTTDAGDTIELWTVLPCRAAGTTAVRGDDRLSRLHALERARDSGALTVRHGDTLTTFRSLAEIDQIIERLRREVHGISPIRRVRILATKGL